MSNNSPLSAQVSITGDVTNLIDTGVTQPVGTVMTTLQSIWNLTFGKFDHWNNKVVIKRENELLMLRQDIFEKTSKIPEEFITEPKMSIVGPAMEASQYFFEESYYREMFSNLISSSMDSRYSTTVHPAFTEFIKQLTPDEAIFLANIKKLNVNVFPISRIKIISTKHKGNLSIPLSIINIVPSELCVGLSLSSNSIIDNLRRLNILEYVFDKHLTREGIYDFAYNSDLYIEAKEIYKNDPDIKLEIVKGMVSFTLLGQDFLRIVM